MSERTRFGQDVGAGLMFTGFGAFGLYLARDYPVGTALRMEPGYVPRLLCWSLVAVGSVIVLRGLLTGDSPVARWHWRPLLFVFAGLMAFRYLVEPGGLVLATFVTVLLGALGGREVRLGEAALLAAGLAIGSVALFVYALSLPMKVLPEFTKQNLAYGLFAASALVIIFSISGSLLRVAARFPLLTVSILLAGAGVVLLLI